MNRRNFFKDLCSAIAALSIPSILLQEAKKPVLLPKIGGCGETEGAIKNIAIFYEEGKYIGEYDFKTPSFFKELEVGNKIGKLTNTWEGRFTDTKKPCIFKVKYHNKTC